MKRSVLFTGIATIALLAGAVPVAALGVAGAQRAAVASAGDSATTLPTREPVPSISPSTPVRVTPTPTAGPPATSGSLPLAQRLRRIALGDQLVTDQELRDFAWQHLPGRSEERVDAWVGEKGIEVACMAGVGFYWDPREANPALTDPAQPVTPADPAARLALDGNAGYPYHWQDAGCRGEAIHETGSEN